MKIVLNIGHGGSPSHYDSGAMSADKTLSEHEFNKNLLGPLVVQALEKLGHKVTTIIQDISFSELAGRINFHSPHCILSLHSNCFNGKASGTETLYYSGSKRSKKLAFFLQNRIVSALHLPDRGTLPRDTGDRGSALLKNTAAPCVILEPFFIDTISDLDKVMKLLPELAEAIAQGVQDWQADG